MSDLPEKPDHDLEPSSSRSAKALGKAIVRFDLDGHDFPPSPTPSSPRNGKRYALATELVYTEGSDQYNASSTPIYQVGIPGLLYLRDNSRIGSMFRPDPRTDLFCKLVGDF